MEFNLKLSADYVNVILRQLDVGQHNLVRPVIDSLLEQIRQQQPTQEASPQ